MYDNRDGLDLDRDPSRRAPVKPKKNLKLQQFLAEQQAKNEAMRRPLPIAPISGEFEDDEVYDEFNDEDLYSDIDGFPAPYGTRVSSSVPSNTKGKDPAPGMKIFSTIAATLGSKRIKKLFIAVGVPVLIIIVLIVGVVILDQYVFATAPKTEIVEVPEEVTCRELLPIQNGDLIVRAGGYQDGDIMTEDINGKQPLRPGSVATYSCSIGFNLMGNKTRTCSNDGYWIEDAPICEN